MGRHCTVCTHADRERIEGALVSGQSFQNISETFDVSVGALFRRNTDHVPAHIIKAQEAKEVSRADDLLGRLMALNKETQEILREARGGKGKNNELALRAIARCERQLELHARLIGELRDGATVNVLITPEWHRLRTVLLDALAPYPQVRLAVVEALRGNNG